MTNLTAWAGSSPQVRWFSTGAHPWSRQTPKELVQWDPNRRAENQGDQWTVGPQRSAQLAPVDSWPQKTRFCRAIAAGSEDGLRHVSSVGV